MLSSLMKMKSRVVNLQELSVDLRQGVVALQTTPMLLLEVLTVLKDYNGPLHLEFIMRDWEPFPENRPLQAQRLYSITKCIFMHPSGFTSSSSFWGLQVLPILG